MAEVEGRKGKGHSCPHLQEDEEFEAGVVLTCSMTMAEGLVIEGAVVAGVVLVGSLAEVLWTLAGVAEAGAQPGVV